MEWKETLYKREDLYTLVWEKPMRDVARMVGVSDVALAKTCRGMGIPLPGRGYWARKASGQQLPRPRLPARASDQPEHYLSRRWMGEGDAPPPEVQRVDRIVVPDTLSDPHHLIAMSLPLLRRGREDRVNLHRRVACLDIHVETRGLLDRAARIMDTSLKALEARGFVVEVSEPRNAAASSTQNEGRPSETTATRDETCIQFCLSEESDRIEVKPKAKSIFATHSPPAEYKYALNGRLGLHITSYHWSLNRTFRRNWTDRENRPIEKYLNQFVESCLQIVECERQKAEEEERREREQLEAQERRREEQERREIETSRLKDLEERVRRWESAHAVRRFIAFVEEDANRRGAPTEGSQLSEWLIWARDHADHLERAALQNIGAPRRSGT